MERLETTFIVCEKPDAASKLAGALADDLLTPRLKYGCRYFEVNRGDERVIICPALGHLYVVDSRGKSSRSTYPVYDFEWKPKHEVEKGYGRQKGWLRAIQELSEGADRYINACDYDVEGSLIGYMILKHACCGADVKAGRMKFSTLTSSDLKEAYQRATSELDSDLAHAGMCRHEIDWLYGVNLSRALTESARRYSRRYTTLSTGRVQGPTLRYIVEREFDVATHVPIPYWTINVTVNVGGVEVEAQYSTRKLETKAEAENVAEKIRDKPGRIEEIEEAYARIRSPPPFDLSTIQAEAYRHFHLSPIQTLGILERLYLRALISYPRTSSQRLPPSIGYRRILEGLGRYAEYGGLTAELLSKPDLRPAEGKKTDPAHPAIYPTGERPRSRLEARENRVLDLVIRRFMTAFAPPATRHSQRATLKIANEYAFHIQGSRLTDLGWTRFYEPYFKTTEASLPPVTQGQKVMVENVVVQGHFTPPPPRYNPGSLLKEMENGEIGTKTTRAAIIDIIHKRGYVAGEPMKPTRLANKVIEVLRRHCPKIVDTSFTRDLEEQMNSIELGKANHDDVVRSAIDQLNPIMQQLKVDEEEIGRELSSAIREMNLQNITLKTPCPVCSSQLRIIRSRSTGKRFIGCTGAWAGNCRFSLPLPQYGTLRLLERFCRRCGFQLVRTRGVRGRSLVSCPKCYVETSKNHKG